MARAHNPDTERPYVLREDRELPAEREHEKTTVWYKLLDVGAYYNAQDGLVEMEGGRNQAARTRIRSGSQVLTALIAGVMRIDNFKDENGLDVQWDPRWPRERKMKALSFFLPHQREEIARAIIDGSELTEEERGNSDSRPGSPEHGPVADAETQNDASAA